jgi:hypothetical protein
MGSLASRTNIGGMNGSGGTGTIIGTITIEIMIGIDAYDFLLEQKSPPS